MADNGQGERKFYNPQALADAVGTENKQIVAASVKADVSTTTIRKMLGGDPNVQLNNLMAVIESSGAKYEKVFDPRYYRQHLPEGAEQN